MASRKKVTRDLTSSEAAKYLGISISFLRKLEEQNILSPYRTKGGHRRFKLKDLDNAQFTHSKKQKDQGERYSRQFLVDGWDQEKLSNAKVMIIGAGALVSKNVPSKTIYFGNPARIKKIVPLEWKSLLEKKLKK